MQYFQYSKTAAERQIHALTLFHLFVMVLDVVSEFFAELSAQKMSLDYPLCASQAAFSIVT